MNTNDKKNNQVSATICSNCGTTTTPLWRRAPNGDTICNACGLYLKARNTLRPPSMKRKFKKQQQQQVQSTPRMGTCPGNGQCNGTGGSPSCEGCPAFNQHQVNRNTALICANCRTTTTPLWRRDEQGNTICNACGLYYKLHHVHRPVSMKRSVIKRRKRIIVTGEEHEEQDELESSNEEEEEEEDEDEDEDEEEQPVLQAIVPPIEDYIVPKRATAFQAYRRTQSENTIPNIMSYRLPPPPRTPPPQQLPSLKRFDPLYDYRQNPYQDLQDFDHAMTRLERLRRRVSPEQTRLLSKLTHSLQDIVGQAEHILSCHNYN